MNGSHAIIGAKVEVVVRIPFVAFWSVRSTPRLEGRLALFAQMMTYFSQTRCGNHKAVARSPSAGSIGQACLRAPTNWPCSSQVSRCCRATRSPRRAA
jgi:hypothetical protein